MSRKQILFALALSAAATAASAGSGLGSSVIRTNYPAESLALGEQGAVEWAVDLDPQARIESCVVTRSSGYSRLDAATCDLIVEHAHFAPAKAEGQLVATTRIGKIVWRLPEGYRQNAARAPRPLAVTKAQLEDQRLLCRRATAPGSHAKYRTYCLTRADWEQARRYAQLQTQEWMSVPGQ